MRLDAGAGRKHGVGARRERAGGWPLAACQPGNGRLIDSFEGRTQLFASYMTWYWDMPFYPGPETSR